MKKNVYEKYEKRAAIIKAMAHPARLIIVDELARGNRCVKDLTAAVGSDMSTVSRHLSILKSAGIVGSNKEGLQVFYFLKTPCVMKFFDCVETVMRDGFRHQEKILSGRR